MISHLVGHVKASGCWLSALRPIPATPTALQRAPSVQLLFVCWWWGEGANRGQLYFQLHRCMCSDVLPCRRASIPPSKVTRPHLGWSSGGG